MINLNISPRAEFDFRRTAKEGVLQALSADSELLQGMGAWYESAHIHSVFRHVVNIDAGFGRLVSLAHRDSDDAPDTIVSDLRDWSGHNIQVGSGVVYSNALLTIENSLSILIKNARPWQCVMPNYAQDESVLRTNLAVAQQYINRYGKGIGLSRYFTESSSTFDQALAESFSINTKGLCEAITQGKETLVLQCLRQLIGLGPGLTPAGDDYLLGLLAVLNIPDSPCHAWRRIGAPIMEYANQQTNAISLSALRHASAGRVRASLIRLCYALMHVSPTPMLAILDRVMSIGSSSGTDIIVGMLSGFHLHLQTKRI